MVVYLLATAFNVSPLEIYKMPISMVKDFLLIHTAVKEVEHEEMEKIQRQHKNKM